MGDSKCDSKCDLKNVPPLEGPTWHTYTTSRESHPELDPEQNPEQNPTAGDGSLARDLQVQFDMEIKNAGLVSVSRVSTSGCCSCAVAGFLIALVLALMFLSAFLSVETCHTGGAVLAKTNGPCLGMWISWGIVMFLILLCGYFHFLGPFWSPYCCDQLCPDRIKRRFQPSNSIPSPCCPNCCQILYVNLAHHSVVI
jgi:hypothetical protein